MVILWQKIIRRACNVRVNQGSTFRQDRSGIFLTPSDAARIHSEYETVEKGKGTPPIYGYVGAASVVALFFATLYKEEAKYYITYICAALAVVNALILASFSYASLQINELKQFETAHREPDSAEAAWEYDWRRGPLSATSKKLRAVYYGSIYVLLTLVSVVLIWSGFKAARVTWQMFAPMFAIVVHTLPAVLLWREFTFVPARWKQMANDRAKALEKITPRNSETPARNTDTSGSGSGNR